MKNLPVIEISVFEHRAKTCFRLAFPFNSVIKTRLKTIPLLKWSATHRVYYVLQRDYPATKLVNILGSKNLKIDSSAITREILYSYAIKKYLGKRVLTNDNTEHLTQFVHYMKGLRLSRSTIRSYFTFVADFLAFAGSTEASKLRQNDIRLFIEKQLMYKHYAISTHRQLVSAIKHFGVFLKVDDLTSIDYLRPKRSSYLPIVLSKEEAVGLLRVTKNLKHRTILALLYSTGLRVGEAINLELSHIDIERRQIFVKNGKGRKDRVVIMAESFVPLFRNYFVSYCPTRYFIESPKGGKYSAGSIRNFLKRSCKAAGITKRVTPHTLRHSYATHLIEMGVGLRYVQELLGHSKPETTMIYTHVAKKDLLSIKSPLDQALEDVQAGDKKQIKSTFGGYLGG